jgi:4-amino-4-deoxy-L-arabinose transferase-like glycosyltransferase
VNRPSGGAAAMNVAILILAALVFLIRWHGALAPAPAGLAFLVPVRDQGVGATLHQLAGSVGVLAAVGLVALGLAMGGRRLVRWTKVRTRGADGPFLAAAAGLAAASAAALGAGLAGLAFPAVAAAVAAGCAVAGLRGAGRARPALASVPPALVLLAVVPLVAALVPETEIDALVYHLALPADYAAAHKVFLAPGSFLDGYWQGQEMLAWPALALGSEPAARLVSWVAALLLAAASACLARRLAGPVAGTWAAAVLLATPPIVLAAAHAKNDALAAALVGAALVARAGGAAPSRALLAGLLCGAAAAVRPSAALALPALLATYVAAPRALRACGFAALGMSVPALPWLLRNGLELGNPVFPLLVGTVPTLGMTGLDRVLADEYLREWSNASPRGIWQGAAAVVTVFGGAAPAVAAGLFAAPLALRLAGASRILAVFALAFGACWMAVFPWLGRFALPAALPLAVLGVARFGAQPRRLGLLGWGSVAGSAVVLLGLIAGFPGPAGCALGLESREGFGRRAWGNWWEAGRELDRRMAPGERAVAVGEWRAYPTRRVLTRWIADEPVVHEIARESATAARLRVRLRQRRVTHLLYNLPQAAYWARYAARYPWDRAAVGRWRDAWDASATLCWRSPVQDPVHGFFLLYRLSRRPGERPSRAWLPGTEGEYQVLRGLVAGSALDPAVDRELDRVTRLLGARADVLARRGCLFAVRGRHTEALAAMRAAERAAPEGRDAWGALGALSIADPEALARFTRAQRDVVNMGFTMGIPVALSPVY